MATKPPSRILNAFTVRDAAGNVRTINRWSTWERYGDVWQEDGVPTLRSAEGRTMYDLGDGRYEEAGTGIIYYVDSSES